MMIARACACAAAVVVAAGGCPNEFEDCSQGPVTMTVGADECALPCTVDFGDVTVPLAEQRRVAVERDSADCPVFLFAFLEDNDGGAFTLNQSNGQGFVLIQFAPDEVADFAGLMTLQDDFGALDEQLTLVGRGVAP